jgi:hypothetical protein
VRRFAEGLFHLHFCFSPRFSVSPAQQKIAVKKKK